MTALAVAPRDRLDDGFRFLMTSLTPVMVPPVPTAGHQNVHLAVGVAPDLLGRGLAVDFRVGRVVKLLRHERVRRRLQQFLRLVDGAVHALFRPASAPTSAPNALSSRRRSRLIVSGKVTMSL